MYVTPKSCQTISPSYGVQRNDRPSLFELFSTKSSMNRPRVVPVVFWTIERIARRSIVHSVWIKTVLWVVGVSTLALDSRALMEYYGSGNLKEREKKKKQALEDTEGRVNRYTDCRDRSEERSKWPVVKSSSAAVFSDLPTVTFRAANASAPSRVPKQIPSAF